MNTILLIISIACFAVLISEASGIIQWAKFFFNFNRLKPLDCPLCLAWWLALLAFLFEKHYLLAPFFAATSSILAICISKVLKNL